MKNGFTLFFATILATTFTLVANAQNMLLNENPAAVIATTPTPVGTNGMVYSLAVIGNLGFITDADGPTMMIRGTTPDGLILFQSQAPSEITQPYRSGSTIQIGVVGVGTQVPVKIELVQGSYVLRTWTVNSPIITRCDYDIASSALTVTGSFTTATVAVGTNIVSAVNTLAQRDGLVVIRTKAKFGWHLVTACTEDGVCDSGWYRFGLSGATMTPTSR